MDLQVRLLTLRSLTLPRRALLIVTSLGLSTFHQVVHCATIACIDGGLHDRHRLSFSNRFDCFSYGANFIHRFARPISSSGSTKRYEIDSPNRIFTRWAIVGSRDRRAKANWQAGGLGSKVEEDC